MTPGERGTYGRVGPFPPDSDAGTHMEVDVPVIAVAIAALPAVALLLSLVTRMETAVLRDIAEDRTPAVR
jgi:hypothetical protein